MTLIIDSIFFSFPIFIIVAMPFYLSKSEKVKAYHYNLRHAAITTLSFAGIAYMVKLVALAFSSPTDGVNEYEGLAAMSRATGPYFYIYVLTMLTFILFPQLTWIKKMRDSKVFIGVLILLIIITSNFERIIIITTSMHRDNVLSPWSYLPFKPMIPSWLIQMGIFVGLVSIVYFVRRKLYPK